MRIVDWPKEIFKIPFLERLLVQVTHGKSPRHLASRLAPLYSAYPPWSYRSVTRNDIKYILDISDYIEWLVYFGITWEPKKNLYSLIREGNTVIDVGANIGEVTFNLAKLVGASGSVHSFEPHPFIFSKLLQNFQLNEFRNIQLNNVGLGSRVEQLYIGPQVANNRGGTRINHSAEGSLVNITSLDNYVSRMHVQKINLIKLDVEGFELKVLRGAENTLRDKKPILFIEINDSNLRAQGDSAYELFAFLNEVGYNNLVEATSNAPIAINSKFDNCHLDIIAR